ncbi:MAG: glutamate racemase [Treponema sp.]|nr:glutamate racemase [Treponema sp.]
MNNKPILFIDSGIGGLVYCMDFIKKCSQEEVCYLADRENFPYGQRAKDELAQILVSLTEKLIKKIDPKIIVLACNTAAVSALEPLRQNFPNIPFVGTVPAIKPAVNASKTGKIGVLGTARTINDPYNQHLVDECGKDCEIIGIAAPDLVEFIEQRFDKADKNEKIAIIKKYIDIFSSKGADALVLGCTHFLHLLEEFQNEAAPSIQIFDSLDGVTKRIEHLLDENNSVLRANPSSKPEYKLLLTDKEPPDSIWENRAQDLGFKLSLI